MAKNYLQLCAAGIYLSEPCVWPAQCSGQNLYGRHFPLGFPMGLEIPFVQFDLLQEAWVGCPLLVGSFAVWKTNKSRPKIILFILFYFDRDFYLLYSVQLFYQAFKKKFSIKQNARQKNLDIPQTKVARCDVCQVIFPVSQQYQCSKSGILIQNKKFHSEMISEHSIFQLHNSMHKY